ncbi:MAG: glutathione S-transferase family protein [Bauldia sp.]
MNEFALVTGYKDTSTWSLRAWLVMRKAGVPFDEIYIRYRLAADKQRLMKLSPTGKVPLLIHKRPEGDLQVWDSIAIAEYLAERFPERRLWPEDPAARAIARSVSAEMHSGFRPLREHLSMDLLGRHPGVGHDGEGVAADIARIEAMWRECRERFGERGGGPFLFGGFTIADAMYAPVATRFRTYAAKLSPLAEAYCQAIFADRDFQAWEEAARREKPAADDLPRKG